MHDRPVSESDGTFDEAKPLPNRQCPKGCGFTLTKQTWASDCGGFDDEKISCSKCGWVRWVEGPDA